MNSKPLFIQDDIFISGREGYHTFRIPAIIISKKGTVLAFCEGRKNSGSDVGYIDILLKRSFDNGETWGNLKIIASNPPDTMGNPCPVVDGNTGTIWLLLCKNPGDSFGSLISEGKAPREVFVMKSTDDGETWSEPVNITDKVKLKGWTWYATGPCHGLQLKGGRLLIPCNHAVYNPETGKSGHTSSHVIYSDDGGNTWQIGGILEEKTNECVALQTSDEGVYINMRSYHGQNSRVYSWSYDGGITWTPVKLDSTLVDPVCQGSAIRYQDKDIILFSNAASTERKNMTVRASFDKCETWAVSKTINEGPSAYSDLAVAPDGTIFCMYERGKDGPYEKISIARFNMEWLKNRD
ncbi:MAG: sialidase family protein [Clostridiales bacterium]|nr:sialidase family protein [Clostridiales bacterium]